MSFAASFMSVQAEAMMAMVSASASNGHEEVIQSALSPSSIDQRSSSVHVNPNFFKNTPAASTSTSSSTSVHINPNFKSSSAASVHINPKFGQRPLPEIPSSPVKPHINPAKLKEKALVDASKTAAYESSIKSAVAAKVFVNPKFKKTVQKASYVDPALGVLKRQRETSSSATIPVGAGGSSSEKENSVLSVTTKSGRKAVFKKIGSRKLIRIRKSSTSKTSVKSLADMSSALKSPKSDVVYKVRTSKRLVKTPNTSSTRRLLNRFAWPLSLKKVKRSPRPFTSPRSLNPFKLDRRKRLQSPSATPSGRQVLKVVTKRSVFASEVVAVAAPPPKPARTSLANAKSMTMISIDGTRYQVTENGRKLSRVQPAAEERTPQPVRTVTRKLYMEGEEYKEATPGVLVRTHHSMTRQSINYARNRSINTILKSQRRSKQFCMFYNKFGKCNKRDQGVCPYIHDADKIAVCRRFLQGQCVNDQCLLSHRVAPEKMPSCKFFLEGVCQRGVDCPYRHVKVNPEAEICPDFLKGFCPHESTCQRRHVMRCPHFERTAKCPKGAKCPLPHVASDETQRKKKPPPEKPKRKSLSRVQSLDAGRKKKSRAEENGDCGRTTAATRYFDTQQLDSAAAPAAEDQDKEEEESSQMKMKRQRLLRKLELAKQAWSGTAAAAPAASDLDDSGPYEEIDEGSDDGRRTPLGKLPSFISLSRYDGDDGAAEHLNAGDEQEQYEERLI